MLQMGKVTGCSIKVPGARAGHKIHTEVHYCQGFSVRFPPSDALQDEIFLDDIRAAVTFPCP